MGVRKRNGFCPLGEAISDGEQVGHALAGRHRIHRVHMKTAEPGSWRWVFHQWCSCVSVNLGGLTGIAFFTPFANVALHAMPYKALGFGLL